MKKAKMQNALLATAVATSGAHAATPQYTSSQAPQSQTQTINTHSKEAALNSKELFDVLRSIELFKTIKTKNPELASEIAESFYKQITPKGTINIDETLTISDKALKTTLINLGFSDKDIVPAMAYFNKIATRKTHTSLPSQTNENCLRGVINADGYPLSYTIDCNGDCTFEGKTSGDIDYLMPKDIKRGSVKESGMRTFLQGVKLQHTVYNHIKENNIKSPYAKKFCEKHKAIIKKYGLEIDKDGNLRQTNPRYDEETIQKIKRNNALKKVR